MDSKEEILLTLLSMGFDYEACNAVLQNNVSTDEAIQRLLTGNESLSNESGANLSHSLLTVSSTEQLDIRNEEKLKSRYTVSESQMKQKNAFELKKRNTIEQEAKRQRLEKKMVREKILKEIEYDKKERQERNPPSKLLKGENSLVVERTEVKENTLCRLQLRQPTGHSTFVSFDKHCLYQELYSHVKENFMSNSADEFSLMQPFPRRFFTIQDLAKSLDELKLFPSAILVLQKLKSAEEEDVVDSLAVQSNTSISPTSMDLSDSDPLLTTHNANDSNLINSSVLKSHASSTDTSSRKATACSKSRLLFKNISDPVDFDAHLDAPPPVHQPDQPQQKYHEHALVFQQALQKKIQESALLDVGPREHHISRQISSLQKLSSVCVAHQLLQLCPAIVNSMHKLSTKIATQILDVLKEKKKLSPTIMQLFLSCKLQEIQLDYYVLTSNDIVEKLRWHTNLRRLSLRSCSCITDVGLITALKGLHEIEYLNLEECTSLTGNILSSISKLIHLRVLKLDKTKINNASVQSFFTSFNCNNLQEISFDFCRINSDAFQDITDCASLMVLSLNHTQVSRLSFVDHFPNLRTLGLKATLINDSHIEQLNVLKKIISLELYGTQITNDGIFAIKDLKLSHLTLPNRTMVNDNTLAYIRDFDLLSLDLSDCRDITDACVENISRMKSLTSLSLSNTKVTDDGLLKLKAPQLESLDLSKTFITNNIAAFFNDMGQLHTLNLAWTQIDDDFMLHLNKCQSLHKLNLSHTAITDQGIGKLALRSLAALLLDWTDVTLQGAEYCIQNCQTLSMVRNSRNKVNISRPVVKT